MTEHAPWQEVGDRVFRRRYEFLDFNVGAVLAEDGVLLVDSRGSHPQAETLVAELRALTALPVRWVVNTHHHWDHVWGNFPLREAEIWGHDRCRTALVEHGEAARAEVLGWDGLPDGYLDEVRDVVILPPGHTFADDVALDVGGRTVQLRYLGRGHTDNDIVVVVPDAGVVFAGDLIEEGNPPNFGDAFPLEWPATLDRVLALAAHVIVPGHGDVVDAAFVATQRHELAAVADLARRCHADGRSVHSAAAGGPFPDDVMAEALERGIAQAAGKFGE